MSQIKRIGIDTVQGRLHPAWRGPGGASPCCMNQPSPRADDPLLQKSAADRNCHGSLRQLASLGSIAGLALGHTARLLPPQYVKPFVKRGKNDRNDAEAICEAAGRPSMRFVPVKSTCATG